MVRSWSVSIWPAGRKVPGGLILLPKRDFEAQELRDSMIAFRPRCDAALLRAEVPSFACIDTTKRLGDKVVQVRIQSEKTA
jgi:hypothetical protein